VRWPTSCHQYKARKRRRVKIQMGRRQPYGGGARGGRNSMCWTRGKTKLRKERDPQLRGGGEQKGDQAHRPSCFINLPRLEFGGEERPQEERGMQKKKKIWENGLMTQSRKRGGEESLTLINRRPFGRTGLGGVVGQANDA